MKLFTKFSTIGLSIFVSTLVAAQQLPAPAETSDPSEDWSPKSPEARTIASSRDSRHTR